MIVVFTGCKTNNNSNAEEEITTLNISIAGDIIETNTDTTEKSVRASGTNNFKIQLYFNGVEFPSYTKDKYNNYIFTKTMYKYKALEMIDSVISKVQIVYGDSNWEPKEIIFESVSSFSSSGNFLSISSPYGTPIIVNGGTEKLVYEYAGEVLVDLDTITYIEIKRTSSLSAEIVFYNYQKQSKKIPENKSWQITALDTNSKEIVSYNSSEETANSFLNINEPTGTNKTTYKYSISLTDDGNSELEKHYLHDLYNTNIRIDYIKDEKGNNILAKVSESNRTYYCTNGSN